MRKPRILVIGHGKSGKDLFTQYLIDEATLDLKFASSSYRAAEIVFKTLAPIYGYETPLECYEDRRHHREEWKQLMAEYNTPDPARLAKEIYKESDIYVGMRTKREFNAGMAENLFDIIFYVNRPGIPDDPTFEIEFDGDIMNEVYNFGSKQQLRHAAIQYLSKEYFLNYAIRLPELY